MNEAHWDANNAPWLLETRAIENETLSTHTVGREPTTTMTGPQPLPSRCETRKIDVFI